MRTRIVHACILLATLLLAACSGISANSHPLSASSSSQTTSRAHSSGPLGVYVGATDGTVIALNPTTGAVRWRHQFTCACPADVQAVANGLIYAGSSIPVGGTSTSTFLAALDASDGSVRWQLTTPGKGKFSAVQSGVAYITSVAPNDLPTQHNEMQARNATSGALLWHTQLSGTGDIAATLAGNTIYLTSFDSSRYYYFEHRWTALYALDAANGAVRWQQSLGASDFIEAVANGRLYLNEGVTDIVCGSNIVALDANDGSNLWAFPKEAATDCASFIGAEHTLVYGITSYSNPASSSRQSTLFALDVRDGSSAWQVSPPFNDRAFHVGLLANGTIYLPSSSDGLLAYRSTNGSPLWHVQGESGWLGFAGGVLYTSTGHSFDALSPATGAVRWRYQTSDTITLSAAANGIVYVVSIRLDATYRRYQTLVALETSKGKPLWRFPLGTSEDIPLIG